MTINGVKQDPVPKNYFQLCRSDYIGSLWEDNALIPHSCYYTKDILCPKKETPPNASEVQDLMNTDRN